ncbi:polysaccharide deacetylase family protein [Marinicrinis lubricantis]|uniref:Polysaccharide deacetylase family protein n=1 Tax=Marinicrinis lubricantis TaxID=2086470 RepID=A0ABW1IMF6_9BACL
MKPRKWLLLCFIPLVYMVLKLLPQVDTYIHSIQWAAAVRHTEEAVQGKPGGESHGVDQELMKRIQEGARQRSEEAKDARIDSVWKAIPAYNGLLVDVEQTYRVSQGHKEIIWVYEEVEPKVRLEDLGAQPIYRGNPNKPMASIMINVAWGDEFLPSILDTLERENVHATFFLDGKWLSKHMDTAKEILAAGHELSNHAYSHKNMSELSTEEAKQEIVRTEQLLKELGVENRLFAPPSGDFDAETVRIAKELNLYTILWTLDTVDWKKPPADSIVRKISAGVEPGSLILMHPTESSSRALPGMIQAIKQKGLIISTVSDLISPKRPDSVETPFYF